MSFRILVFQPDGFDAYDLAPVAALRAPNLSRARVHRHRSAEWKAHFEDLARKRLRQEAPDRDGAGVSRKP